MKPLPFKGTGVALVTPFNEDRSIDFSSLEKLMEFNIESGVDYFVVLGTTGETATLSAEEKTEIWKFVAKTNRGRIPLVAGIGGNHTEKVASEISTFSIEGYQAILSVSPYYNKPSQEGIFQHFMRLQQAAPLPIIIYNVPGRTSSNISAETTLRLARSSAVFIGIKEASGNFSQIMQIVKNQPENFLVISGDDLITLPLMSFGVAGVISVVAQAFPKDFSNLVALALKGNFEEAQKHHFRLLEFMELLFAEGSPAGVKATLSLMGIAKNHLRLPLVPASDSLRAKIKTQLESMA
jgi:4-hydroxy-tetrahydrodipicolinate synthase